MSFCEKCGNQLNEDSLFCSKCGNSIKQNNLQNQSESTNPVVSTPQSNNPTIVSTNAIETQVRTNSFIDYLKVSLKRFWNGDFMGRTSLKEYWCVMGFMSLIQMFYIIFIMLVGTIVGVISNDSSNGAAIYLLFLLPYLIISLLLLRPSIAITCRRFHDINISGWFMLVPFFNLVVFLKPGDEGNNKYGSKPDL